MDVFSVLVDASADEPHWGLSICDATGLGPGTVYPILERLLKHGLVSCQEETEPHPGRPARLYYAITSDGKTTYRAALNARASRTPLSRRFSTAPEGV
jgi:PadR family transcriptional regulator PadR